MLDLSDKLILVAFGSTRVPETIRAIKHCQKLVKFYDTIYLTDTLIDNEHIRHIPVRNIPSIKDYQKFIVNESSNIILSSIPNDFNGHFLCINWDGFIVDTNAWVSDFLIYDYIGAPWPWFKNAVGNGGFCLKSKKFIEIQQKICQNFSVINNEDIELCLTLKKKFEHYGCRYASANIGYKFSTEVGDINKNLSFGFHDFKYNPQFAHIIKNDNN